MQLLLDEVLTSDGKHPERKALSNSTINHNIEVLIPKVLELLKHYGNRPVINSGYRDLASNAAAGGSAKSSHCEGRAIDFSDVDGSFAAWCLKNQALMAALDLYMEDPAYTHGWVHITDRAPRSGKIVFKP